MKKKQRRPSESTQQQPSLFARDDGWPPNVGRSGVLRGPQSHFGGVLGGRQLPRVHRDDGEPGGVPKMGAHAQPFPVRRAVPPNGRVVSRRDAADERGGRAALQPQREIAPVLCQSSEFAQCALGGALSRVVMSEPLNTHSPHFCFMVVTDSIKTGHVRCSRH